MIKNLLLNFDGLSAKPSLYYQSRERYRTFTGLLLTILQVFLITFFAVYFLIEFTKNDSFKLRTSKETNYTAKVDFRSKLIFYRLVDGFNNEIDPRIAIAVPTYWRITENMTDVIKIRTARCAETASARFKHQVHFDIANFTCFDLAKKDEVMLEVSKQPYYSSYMNIYIARCQNTTENGNHCFTPEVIEQMLRRSSNFVSLYMESNILNHLNVSDPIVFSYYTEQVPISIDLLLIRYLDYRYLIYESDNGLFFESKSLHHALYLDPFLQRNEILLGGERVWFPDTLQILRIRLDGNYAEKHNRCYVKIQTILANIGGIANAIYVIMSTIGSALTKGLLFVDFANRELVLPNAKNRTISLTQCNVNQSQANLTEVNQKIRLDKSEVVNVSAIYWWDNIIFSLRLYRTKKVNHMIKCEGFVRKVLSVDSIIKNMKKVDTWVEWKGFQEQPFNRLGDSSLLEVNKHPHIFIEKKKRTIDYFSKKEDYVMEPR